MKKLTFCVITIFFASCQSGIPLAVGSPKNNKTYTVEYLFEHDGCKVYKFQDGFQTVYFTNCRGETTALTDSTKVYNSTNMKKQ